jgi:serine/threonine-protein kinase
VLLLLVLAGLLYLLAANFNSDDEPPVETEPVPLVVGRPVAEATTVLEEAGFEVETKVEPSERPVDEVTAQDPEAGEDAEVGSTVTLTVSGGPELVPVPDVRNKPQQEATTELTTAGFIVNAVPVESNEVEEGLVVSQDPEAGAEAAPGATVTINVSSGSGTIQVPDVAGRSEADARAALQQAGFTNIASQQEASNDVPAGSVVRSDPGGGAEVAPDQQITLFVSSGPQKVNVPGVEGRTEDNARNLIEGAGLSVEVVDEDVADPGQDGRVLGQTPPANTQVDANSTVTIVVGRFREPEDPPGGGGGDG